MPTCKIEEVSSGSARGRARSGARGALDSGGLCVGEGGGAQRVGEAGRYEPDKPPPEPILCEEEAPAEVDAERGSGEGAPGLPEDVGHLVLTLGGFPGFFHTNGPVNAPPYTPATPPSLPADDEAGARAANDEAAA